MPLDAAVAVANLDMRNYLMSAPGQKAKLQQLRNNTRVVIADAFLVDTYHVRLQREVRPNEVVYVALAPIGRI